MYNKTTLAKERVPFVRVLLDLSTTEADVVSISEYAVHESRATRLVKDSTRFMSVAFTKGSKSQHLRTWLEEMTQPGKTITFKDGQEYTFLGFTESNLKAGQVLFFREGADFTVETLKDHFGSDLKTVYQASGYGKYAARLGLSFSSTTATRDIEPKHCMLLDDLRAADGSLTSDGNGLIIDSFAADLCADLGVPSDTAVFQIRRGGIKGTLTRCPADLFNEICGGPGKLIAYRHSMVKYKEGPHVLEVQQISKPPKSARLNKQFIVLLLTLGIPFSVFEELLQMQLDEIDKITTHREKALHCVDGEVDAEGDGFYQELYEMLLAGHDMNEPYLAAQLRRFQNTSRDALRKKLNIPVKGSSYLFGVVDHCGVLKEGEVYINLPTKGGPQVGPVATMRNPAYDPDGVRVLEAVNKPELNHLTNCIVFAASGARSEPDRMGGGDLDGDTYFVVFNPLLIPTKPRVTAPPGARAISATRSTTTISFGGRPQTVGRQGRTRRNVDMRKDAIDTFVHMRCNFLLGELSNEWMTLVGTTPALADSPLCKVLVPMIESALDVVKSGESLAILRHDFDRLKHSNERGAHGAQAAGWKNPLNALAELVPQSPTDAALPVELTCDPQLVLQTSTSSDAWDTLVGEAGHIMRAYNRSLQLAIEADKDAKAQGLQDDDKRADSVKAAIVAKHFPPVENVLVDIPQYLLKASAWYFTGYKSGKQSFAWLGARWLNQLKAMQSGFVPIAVGAMSTPLAVSTAAPPTSAAPRVVGAAQVPPTPASLPRPSRLAGPRIVPSPIPSPDSDFEMDSEDNASGLDTEFELIDKESAYDTAVEEELVPAVTGLRIDTAQAPPVVREDSDTTLVDVAPTVQTPTPRRPRPRAPLSSVSPTRDATARPRPRQTRAAVPPPDASANANVTTSRLRTREQARMLVAPEAARGSARTPATRAPTSGHTHAFLLQAKTQGTRPVRVCACGAIWKGA